VSAPALKRGAAGLYAAVAPLSPQDEQLSWPLAQFCGGLGEILRPLDELTEPLPDGRYGLDSLLDPDLAPRWTLPWLAMVTGTKLQQGLTEQAEREAIKQTPAQDRGTAPAIIGLARRLTSDPAHAPMTFVSPYNGSVHEALLAVIDIPDDAFDTLGRDLAQVQPAWLKITCRNDPGWTVAMAESAYAAKTIAQLEADYASVGAFETATPAA
jgi:hypothetical protein